MDLSSLKDIAYRAFYWTSFRPEERGEQTIKEYEEDLQDFLKSIPEEHHQWAKEKYISLLRDWLLAHGRTFSVMITGASGFNNARHSRNNNRERAAYEKFSSWREHIIKKLNRKEKLSLDAEYLATEQKIEDLKLQQERVKLINKIVRSKKLSDDEKIDEIVAELGYEEKTAIELIKPDRYNRFGIPAYVLTNNLGRIKHYEEKLEKLNKRLEAREKVDNEYEINGIRVVENVEADRLQLFFDGKPESNIREELKKNGFRWSPNNGCWQGYLRSADIKKLDFMQDGYDFSVLRYHLMNLDLTTN